MKTYIPLFVAILLAGNPFAFSQNIPSLHVKPDMDFFQTPEDGNLVQPTGVAVNSEGHIFIFNKGHRQLMEFDTEGKYIRTLGQGMFIEPHGLRIDADDNIWTTDLSTHLVLKMDPYGRLLMVLGQKETPGLYDDVRNEVLFNKPADVAFGLNGDIFIADGYGNHRIVHVDKHGKRIKIFGKQGQGKGEFNNPHNIVADPQGNIYITDRNNKRMEVYDHDGNHLHSWTHLGKPWGLAITGEGHLFMSEGDAEELYKLDLKGNILGKAVLGAGTAPGKMRAAHGIAVGKNGAIYVTEVLNWRVQKFIVE